MWTLSTKAVFQVHLEKAYLSCFLQIYYMKNTVLYNRNYTTFLTYTLGQFYGSLFVHSLTVV